MNKGQFIEAIAERAGLSRKEASAALEAVIATVTETLKAGDKITVTGFGTFETRKRASRNGRNPHTGEAITIAAKTAPAFKPGKALKDALN